MSAYKFETLQLHVGQETPDPATDARAVPIYATTSYVFHDCAHAAARFGLADAGNIYGRLTNSTQDVLEKRVAALEGGVAALAVASGAAAITYTLEALGQNGGHFVAQKTIYGGSYNLLEHTLPNFGITATFVNIHDLAEVEAAIQPDTRAIYIETLGNPNSDIPDIDALAVLAHKHGLPLVVDNTFGTPYLIRPIEHGADIVVHSATKFLGGHGTAMCGIVTDAGTFDFNGNPRFPLYTEPDVSYHGVVFAKDCGNAGFLSRLRAMMLRDLGGCCAPLSAFLIMQGIETLSLRMRHISESALAIAEHLESHPDVAFVNYPGLKSSPYYPLVRKYLPRGAGGVFTFGLKGGRERGAKLIDSLELILHVTNVGDSRTLISHPASTTHSQLSDEQLAESGITPETVRLSVGLEDPADLIADLDRAIAAAK